MSQSPFGPARWMLGLAAVGLVAAGAIGGGLITRQVVAQAEPASGAESTLAPSPEVAPVARKEAAAPRAAVPICVDCGSVESVQAQTRQGDASGVGAVAGGVIGGLIGNQMGGGNGKKAMTVVGAVGGGLAGNEIEKQRNASTVYVTQVRMDDGSLRRFTRNTQLSVGQRVRVDGERLVLQ